MFYVYLLASRPQGTLYVGLTSDLAKRVFEHKSKAVPGFTPRYGVDTLAGARRRSLPISIPGPDDPRGQGAHVGEDGVDEAGLGVVIGIEVEGEALHQGRADDGGVGGARHRGGLLRAPDAEADRDRQRGEPAQPRDRGGDIDQIGRAGAGYPGDRDIIDKAAGVLDDLWQALLVAGWSGEADDIEARSTRRKSQFGVLLGRQVDDDDPID